MSEELKPCPFCGGEGEVRVGLISCKECGAAPVSIDGDNIQNNVKAWNTRAPSEKPIIAEVREVLSILKNSEQRARDFAVRRDHMESHARANAFEICIGAVEEALGGE